MREAQRKQSLGWERMVDLGQSDPRGYGLGETPVFPHEPPSALAWGPEVVSRGNSWSTQGRWPPTPVGVPSSEGQAGGKGREDRTKDSSRVLE